MRYIEVIPEWAEIRPVTSGLHLNPGAQGCWRWLAMAQAKFLQQSAGRLKDFGEQQQIHQLEPWACFYFPSLYRVLVFRCALRFPPSPSTTYSHTTLSLSLSLSHTDTEHSFSLSHTQLPRTQLTHTHNSLTHTTYSHTTHTHTQLSLSHTHNLLTHDSRTHNSLTHTTHSHNSLTHAHTHTTHSHTHAQLRGCLCGRRGTWRHPVSFGVAGVALMALGWLWHAWFPFDALVATAVCVIGVALGDIQCHLAW